MGFLLGEALEFIVKTYTDSDNQVETIKIHISEYSRLDNLHLSFFSCKQKKESSAEGAFRTTHLFLIAASVGKKNVFRMFKILFLSQKSTKKDICCLFVRKARFKMF